jgi:hypothetical protein
MEEAARIALQGAETRAAAIIPIYSLVWPVGAASSTSMRVRSYFETLSSGYHAIRQRHGLTVSEVHAIAARIQQMRLDRTTMEVA